jgi:hypothetical protein
MTRGIWVSAVLLGFVAGAGCASKPKSIIDTPRAHDLELNQFSFYDDGDGKLVVNYQPKEGDLALADVRKDVYDGDLYLAPQRASHPAKPREIAIDTTKLKKLRQPWQEHVYWRTLGWSDNAVAAVTYRGPLDQHVGRTRLEVTTRPTEPAEARDIPPLPESTFEPYEARVAARKAIAASQPAATPAPAPAPAPETKPAVTEPSDPLTPSPSLLIPP